MVVANISFKRSYFVYTRQTSVAKRRRATGGVKAHSKLTAPRSTSSEETLLCLPSLPVKQQLTLHILLLAAQLPAVRWNTGGATMLSLMNHSDRIGSRGDALSLSWTWSRPAVSHQ